jgi:prepilin-type N-terminal cleavage/methylation domain-containing protein
MNKYRGFTLIEITVVIGILGVILVVVSEFQVNIFKHNKYSADSLQSAQDSRSILRVMVKELRTAKLGNNGAYPLIETATSSITFYSDIDADGLKERIHYYIASTTLYKGVIKPSGNPYTYNSAQEKLSILAYNIKNATSTSLFDYYDETYSGNSSALTQPINTTDVRLIKINLMIDADPNRSPIPRTYTSQVMLRNIKDNL